MNQKAIDNLVPQQPEEVTPPSANSGLPEEENVAYESEGADATPEENASDEAVHQDEALDGLDGLDTNGRAVKRIKKLDGEKKRLEAENQAVLRELSELKGKVDVLQNTNQNQQPQSEEAKLEALPLDDLLAIQDNPSTYFEDPDSDKARSVLRKVNRLAIEKAARTEAEKILHAQESKSSMDMHQQYAGQVYKATVGNDIFNQDSKLHQLAAQKWGDVKDTFTDVGILQNMVATLLADRQLNAGNMQNIRSQNQRLNRKQRIEGNLRSVTPTNDDLGSYLKANEILKPSPQGNASGNAAEAAKHLPIFKQLVE